HLLRAPDRALSALCLLRLPSARTLGVVGWLRALLRDLQRFRPAGELVVVLGPGLLVRLRALLRLRVPPDLPSALPPLLGRRRMVLVVGRLVALEQSVGRGHAQALQVAAAAGRRAAIQVRLGRAVAPGWKHGACRLPHSTGAPR